MALEAGSKGGEEAAAAAAAAIGKARNGKSKKDGAGRKSSDGQEMKMDGAQVAAEYKTLKKLYQKSLDAKDAFSAGVKKVAEGAGFHSATVRSYVKSAVDGKFEERRRLIEQAEDLFALGDPEAAAESEGSTKQ